MGLVGVKPRCQRQQRGGKELEFAGEAPSHPEMLLFSVSPGIGAPVRLDEVKGYRDAGVHQVVVGTIPRDPKTAQGDIERLAEKIVVPAVKF